MPLYPIGKKRYVDLTKAADRWVSQKGGTLFVSSAGTYYTVRGEPGVLEGRWAMKVLTPREALAWLIAEGMRIPGDLVPFLNGEIEVE